MDKYDACAYFRIANLVIERLAYSAIGSTEFSGSYSTVKPVSFTLSTLNSDTCIQSVETKIRLGLLES